MMDNNNYSQSAPPSNGKAIAALVMGIIACASFWIPMVNIIPLVLSVVGLILAIQARKENAGGIATAGLVLCIIGLVITGIGFFSCTVCALCTASSLASYGSLGF